MLWTKNSNEHPKTRDQQKHDIEIPQNRLDWSGSRLMIVDNGWIFSICEIYCEYGTAGHLVFWKLWPAVELKKVLGVTKHAFVFWAQRKPNIRLEIYKAFQDRLTCLNSFDFVKFSEYGTAGHLLFLTPWPVTGHIATAKSEKINLSFTLKDSGVLETLWYLSARMKIVVSVNVSPNYISFIDC